MAETYSWSESYDQEDDSHFENLENWIEDCSRGDDDLTDRSKEEEDYEEFKDTYSCMTTRLLDEDTPWNPS